MRSLNYSRALERDWNQSVPLLKTTQDRRRRLLALPLRAYSRIYHRLQIEGAENLPTNGSFVMISNHTSHLDALCLLAALPVSRLDYTFAAAATDYFGTNFRRLALSLFMNSIPFSRGAGVRNSLSRCRQLLTVRENILLLFPE